MVLSLATSRLIVGYGLIETCSGPDLLVGEAPCSSSTAWTCDLPVD